MTYNVFGGTLGLNLAQSINQSLATRKLSVCLSVKRVDCDKTEEIPVHQIFVPHERSFTVLLYLVLVLVLKYIFQVLVLVLVLAYKVQVLVLVLESLVLVLAGTGTCNKVLVAKKKIFLCC